MPVYTPGHRAAPMSIAFRGCIPSNETLEVHLDKIGIQLWPLLNLNWARLNALPYHSALVHV
jgi:hypothetical protein